MVVKFSDQSCGMKELHTTSSHRVQVDDLIKLQDSRGTLVANLCTKNVNYSANTTFLCDIHVEYNMAVKLARLDTY